MNRIVTLLLSVALVIFIITGVVYSIEWHKKEYPSGTLIETTDRINIFYGGWYCNLMFISFETVYQISELGIQRGFEMNEYEKEFIDFLDASGLKYNISYTTWCDTKREVIISFDEPITFSIEYYTYDRMLAGNEIHYSKTKVMTYLKVGLKIGE